ncbi:osmotically inducible protein C [Actinoplanes sp. NBRC 14428]|uniref:Putative OsmC-like protein n=1 Tax=Pseudosporangium ferrugineum TaxID=439699 RepID=A0A2T0SEL6_9ACTN|nr:OsmC family protein [Pseudosporangium ferrugineum]PRY31865.1 putative OsmC-like protein [Pseudosporangium ferrugineum]BCJ49899.1 osmotically inducible protein C [Actinoplanes sp. NBRC 14428]
MDENNVRSVEIERTGAGEYVVRNVRGGEIALGAGDDATFTPVELLLAAIGGCTGIDVDLVTGRRAEPSRFVVRVSGDKVRDEAGGNRMRNLRVEFDVAFPADEGGDRAREILPRIMAQSHDRLCTVSRTVELGTAVTVTRAGDSHAD